MDESNEPGEVVIRVSRTKLTNLIAARDAYRKAQRESHELSAAFEKAGEDLDHATMDLVATVATAMLLDGLDPSEVPEAELQQIRDAYALALKEPVHATIQELFRLGINAQIQANALSKRIDEQTFFGVEQGTDEGIEMAVNRLEKIGCRSCVEHVKDLQIARKL